MSKKISTETPLDFDYFHMKEDEDTETVRQFLEEYNRVGGLTCSYYPLQDAGRDMDVIFLEKINKKWGLPIKVKFIVEYLEEVIENQQSGIMILDTLNLKCEKGYFKKTTKWEPLIGDLVKIDYADLMFEITNVVDAEAMLFGQKFNWQLTGKIWIESHEDDNITHETHDPGEAPGERDNLEEKILDDIEDISEEEYQYEQGDNPFDPDSDNPFGEH